MDRNVLMTMSVLPKRRRRITTQRASSDEDGRSELRETVRFRDRDGDFLKRRRVDETSYREVETGNSSDEDDYSDESAEQKQNRSFTPAYSPSLGVGDFRGASVDGALGFLVPRKARSGTRRLQECRDSERSLRKTFGVTAMVSPRPENLKKKMKSSEMRPGLSSFASDFLSSSTTQTEMEVAEALFDLMKQSRPTDRYPKKFDTDVKDEEASGKVKVKADGIVADSFRETKTQVTIAKEKYQDAAAGKLMSGHELVSKREMGSPRESESPSCGTVNARDIRDPTATSAYLGRNNVAEAKKGPKLDIDLMAPPPLPCSPERDPLDDVAPQPIRKNEEGISKNDRIIMKIMPNMPDEKPGVSPHLGQLPSPFMSLPSGMSNWHLPQLPVVYPMDASDKSLIMAKVPQFKLPQPRKISVLHRHIASNIQHHKKLISKCIPPAPSPSYESQMVNLHTTPAAQSTVGLQAAKNSAAVRPTSVSDAAMKTKNGSSNDTNLFQQARSNSISRGPGLVYPNRQEQLSKKEPPSSPATPTCNAFLPPSSSSMISPVNFSFPGGFSPLGLNNPFLSSGEASFMAMLPNNGYPVTISNISLPQFKGGSSPVTNATQNQQLPFSQAPKKQSAASKTLGGSFENQGSENGQKTRSSTVSFFNSPYGNACNPMSKVARRDDSAAPVLNFSTMMQNSGIFQLVPDPVRSSNQLPKLKNYTQQQLQHQLIQVQAHHNRGSCEGRSGS